MKNILILFVLTAMSTPLFSHAQERSSNQSPINKEAGKIDNKLKKDLNKAKKDVDSEICSTGEEQCTIHNTNKKLKHKAPAAPHPTSPNAIENKDSG